MSTKKQNIFFFWTEIKFDNRDALVEFCKSKGFIYKWQKQAGWSIGIFEEDIQDVDKNESILVFLEKLDSEIIKQSKSRNDVQARAKLKGSAVSQLRELREFIQSKGEALNNVCLEDILRVELVEKIEKLYRYKFTDNEVKKIEDETVAYIKAYPTLEKHFFG